MADFTPKKIEDISQLNGGKEYINEVDIPDADDWNKVVESQLWTQYVAELLKALMENPINNSLANFVGTPSITIEMAENGKPQFVVKYIKGEQGETGDKGDKGDIGSLIYDDGITQGGTPEAAPTIPWSYLSTQDKNKILEHRIYDFEIVTFGDSRQALYQIYAPTQTSLGLRRVAILTGKDGKNGTTPTIDTAMSDTSTNPVQNKVIKAYIDDTVASAITTILNTAV